MLLFLVMQSAIAPAVAEAANAQDFNAGNIMGDQVMSNYDSMSSSQIQQFLEAKGVDCSGTLCLKNYTDSGTSASTIIYQAAQDFHINPQVLLVLLQKENGLVTSSSPALWNYRTATGYGCPDNSDCNADYFGFTNQIRWSATMFRAILDESPSWYTPYVIGTQPVLYNPVTACGSLSVTIQNLATVALYSYTPYVPNAAALAAGYGLGDDCSAYGNRNFYLYFTDWFGSTQGSNVYAIRYDTTTDSNGDTARIGFGLSHKPTSNVMISYLVTSRSNAEIIGSASITFTPNNWNRPEENIITIRGKYNQYLTTNMEYSLYPTLKPKSSDVRYASLSRTLLPIVAIAHQNDDRSQAPSVYRLYSPTSAKHTVTADATERDTLIGAGWSDGGVSFNFCRAGNQTIIRMTKGKDNRLVKENSSDQQALYNQGYVFDKALFSANDQGNVPVYWQYDSLQNRSLYTTAPTEGTSSGFVSQGIAFYVCSNETEPVYRLQQPYGSHFYTASPGERDKAIYTLGYRYDGLGFYACTGSLIDKPVYRFYNKNNGVRFYTTELWERDKVRDVLKYNDEGIKFYSCKDGNTPVYRLYQNSTGRRFYTSSEGENNKVVNYGYTAEGTKFMAY